MAKIYLEYKNDRKNYAKCYGEIVESAASLESRLLLGDAYMNIQEPEQAVVVYTSALDAYPEELSLRGKIGEALTKTHDFKRVMYLSFNDGVHLRDNSGGCILRKSYFDIAS